MSQENLSYYEHLTQGSDHGMDTMDLICDKVFEILPDLVQKCLKLEDYEGVLVLADFYKDKAQRLFDMCYFEDDEEYENQVKRKVYLEFMFKLQRASLQNFVYLETWGEDGDKNISSTRVLELLREWDSFLNKWLQKDKPKLETKKQSLWQYYYGDMNTARKTWAWTLEEGLDNYIIRVIDMPISKMIFEITNILSCLKYGWINLTDIQYISLTQSFVKAARELPEDWDFWINLFDLAEWTMDESEESKVYLSKKIRLEAIKTWPMVISSFQQDWISFGKEYFAPKPDTVENVYEETIEKSENVSYSDNETLNFDVIWNSPNIILLEKKFGKICITGEFGLSRDKIEKLLGHNSWQVTKTISSKTDYLLVGYKPGSKVDEALEKNIKLIDWAGLLELISTNNAKHGSSGGGREIHEAKKRTGPNWSRLDH